MKTRGNIKKIKSSQLFKVGDKRAGQLSFDGLPAFLGFHLRLAHVAMIRDFLDTLRSLDLTQRLNAILTLIGANPGASQIALAELLSTDRATMMAMVDRLENRGLLERRASTTDRRVRELYLTPKGQKLLAKVAPKISVHEKRFTTRFSKSELHSLIEFLRRIHGRSL